MLSLLLSTLCPKVYTPLSWGWFRFAKGLETVMSKVILCLIFFLAVTPVGWIRQLFGKDSLHLRDFAKKKDSVFEERTHSYQKADMEKQF
jgi:hypothetical protein